MCVYVGVCLLTLVTLYSLQLTFSGHTYTRNYVLCLFLISLITHTHIYNIRKLIRQAKRLQLRLLIHQNILILPITLIYTHTNASYCTYLHKTRMTINNLCVCVRATQITKCLAKSYNNPPLQLSLPL
jgi:hypothetical protein